MGRLGGKICKFLTFWKAHNLASANALGAKKLVIGAGAQATRRRVYSVRDGPGAAVDRGAGVRDGPHTKPRVSEGART